MKTKKQTDLATKELITDKNISTRQHNCGGNKLENLKIEKSSLEQYSFSTAC